VETLTRIRVLVEMSTIELGESVRVRGEMRRHPVENHADPMLMQHIDERQEIVGRAVARRRREIAGRLIAPRAVERVLGNRQPIAESLVSRVFGKRTRTRGRVGSSPATLSATSRNAL
jgi:hypothetical protein